MSAVVQREQRPNGLGGSDLVNKGGSSGGVGEDKGFRAEQGKHDIVTAGERRAGQLAEGHGAGSSRLVREKRGTEAPGVWRLPPLHSVTPE